MVRLAPLFPDHDDLKIIPTYNEADSFMLVEGVEGLIWMSNGQLKAAVPGLMNVARRHAEND